MRYAVWLAVAALCAANGCTKSEKISRDVEQINKLLKEGYTLDVQIARRMVQLDTASITLLARSEIYPDLAKEVAEFDGEEIVFDGYATMSSKSAAEAIAKFRGKRLRLDDLTELSGDAASALAEFKGEVLSLNSLHTLDAGTAKGLAAFRDTLHLNGVNTLTAEAVAELAQFRGTTLYLRGLRFVDASTAKVLAGFRGDHLFLEGLGQLTPDAAEAFAGFRGRTLFLDGLTTLSDKAATALRANPNIRLPEKFKHPK